MESVHDDDDEAGDEPSARAGQLVRRGGGAPEPKAKEPQGAAEQHEQHKQHKQQWRWQQRRRTRATAAHLVHFVKADPLAGASLYAPQK